MKSLLVLITVLCACPAIALPPEPAVPQQRPTALLGGVAHLGDGTVIRNSAIAFESGTITFVGSAADFSLTGHELIQVPGQHVYPGFILIGSNLGLIEVNSVRATNDMAEVGALNPNVRSLVAYNTDSEVTPTLRRNGVLTAQIAPRGGLVSGQSSVVSLDAWNWEDAAILADDGLYLNWPSRRTLKLIEGTTQRENVPDRNYDQRIASLTRLFHSASVYDDATDSPNVKLRAMRRLFDGDQRLYITVNGPQEIVSAISFTERFNIRHPVIVGGSGSLAVADFLVRHQVPVVLTAVHRLPTRTHSPVDEAYSLPAQLNEAGVLVGLTRMTNSTARNLPFDAGTASAYGLGAEKALQIISLNNARIIGIDDELGSLAVGKRASLFVSNGDALDMMSNDVTLAYIDGREITLSGTQEVLHERFRRKYSPSR